MAEALGFDPHDPGRRAHYGEFYGLTELPDAPIFMVHGNCQAESLRVLLHGAGEGRWHGVRVPPVHELLAEDLPHLTRLLNRCSFVATQPVASGYRGLPLGSDEILALTPADASAVKYPVMRWTALMPTLAIVRAAGVTDPPIAPYHDLRVLVAAAQGQKSVRLEPVSPEAVRSSRDESLRQLRTRQEAHGTVDAASLFEAAGPNAAHVINHPSNQVLMGVARAILDDLGRAGEVKDPGRVLLGGIRAPIYESTLDALGYRPEELEGGPREHWIIGGEKVSEADVAAEHLGWYARFPQVVAAGMKRHERLIRTMQLVD
ncbi:WcbI family polysaccharide biosynthesis putative acetyltransferase [Kocuria carniphila]|uniref:WcbI family polysaccharide biosynthesis putative acetyltransferase n=1 Tax=Kocuria carniphila TaxID=262208 RepID=UPI00101B9AB3|nr:WcbI family polysaccharide biosynthesis putative acetyltransferase [Kocuria carniphila]